MICYQDRTFCSGEGCVRFDTCTRALTPEVIDRAGKAKLLIARFSEPRALNCWTSEPEGRAE